MVIGESQRRVVEHRVQVRQEDPLQLAMYWTTHVIGITPWRSGHVNKV